MIFDRKLNRNVSTKELASFMDFSNSKTRIQKKFLTRIWKNLKKVEA